MHHYVNNQENKKAKYKPWMIKGFPISIKNKQKMSKTHYLNGTKAQKYLYKLYANKLTKIKIWPKNIIIMINYKLIKTILKELGM